MNWIVFAIVGWLMFGLELGLKDGLELGSSGVAPSFVVVLLVFISLSAPKLTTLWACAVIGFMLDLTRLWPTPDAQDAVVTIGPYTLGCLLGGYTVLTMRALVIRRNPLTMLLLSIIAAFMMHLTVIALMTARSWYDPAIVFGSGAELARRTGSAVYTGFLALVLGPTLGVLTPLFGFRPSMAQQRRRRRPGAM